jgi:hypothetical protein
MANIEMFNKRDGNFSPDLYHSRQEIRLRNFESAIKTHREADTSLPIKNLRGRQMSVLKLHLDLPLGQFLNIHTKELQQIGKFQMINDA